MRHSYRIGLGLAALASVGAAAAAWAGARRQERVLSSEIDRLRRAGMSARALSRPSDRDFTELPAPVARYLRWARAADTSIDEVRLTQNGTLRTDVHNERWMPFEADHVVVPPALGFVWDARVTIAPLLHVRVRDSYIDGRGSGHVALMSVLTVGADAGTFEMNSGSLHRYLAEAVWYPTALLPSSQLQWTPIDDSSAIATLTDLGVSVSLEFRFADSGEVTGIYTAGRWGRFNGGYRQVPWEGRFRNYRQRDGLLIPTEAEVGWYVDDHCRVVWRGTVTSFSTRLQHVS